MTDKSIEKIAVVIPNLNGENYLAEAIDSLLEQTVVATIIIVENASTDNSMAVIDSYGDKLVVLKNDKNLGFAGGVNVGIRYALENNFNAVALFNNDAVAAPTWLAELSATLGKNEKNGIVTGKIELNGRNQLDSTGEFYTSWGLPYPRGRGEQTDTYKSEEVVFGASGGASIYRSTMLRQIGLFDEKFFAYYEDTDISFRAQLAGWKVIYTPSAVVSHRQGETSKKMVRGFTIQQTFKNLPMLFWKNVPVELLPSIGVRFLVAYTLIFGKALLSKNCPAALKGFLSSILLAPHTLSERRRIQQSKSVPTSYISFIIVKDLPPDQTGIRKIRSIFTRS